jgi:CDP-diacylglycerol--serine O-phosphatidyltransferase
MIRRNIPNALTCGNLLCGCIGVVEAFHNNLLLSCVLIGVALIFDFLDGFLARVLKVSSAIGRDLDSLADMVTFGRAAVDYPVPAADAEHSRPCSVSGKAYAALIMAIFLGGPAGEVQQRPAGSAILSLASLPRRTPCSSASLPLIVHTRERYFGRRSDHQYH